MKKIFLFDLITNFIMFMINIIIRIKFLFVFNNSNNYLTSNNKTCVVIGNGPSLKDVDLSKFQKYDCMTVNGFYLGNVTFKSKFHIMIDPVYNSDKYDMHIENAKLKNKELKFIVSNIIYNSILSKGIDRSNLIKIFPVLNECYGTIKYKINKLMTASNNVIPVAIECAMSMGYKNIVLLGCDFSLYAKTNGAHYYDVFNPYTHIVNNYTNLIACAMVHKMHYAIEKTAKKNGINILNATIDSYINAYKSVSIDEALCLEV